MIIQPDNVSRANMTSAKADGTSAWEGGSALPYLPNVALQTAEPMHFGTSFPLHFTLLSDITAVSVSGDYAEWNTLGRNLHAVQVASTSGTFSATVLLEGTLDGVKWFTVASLTSEGITQYTGLYQSLRVSVSNYTSGTITVTALEQRT